jgi:hypothetical protein
LPLLYNFVADGAYVNNELHDLLDKFHARIVDISNERVDAVKSSIKKLVNSFRLGLHYNKYSIKYTEPILSDPLYTNMKVIGIESVELILPVVVADAEWAIYDCLPGYVCLRLHKQLKHYNHIRSEQSVFISLTKITCSTWDCMDKCLACQSAVNSDFALLPLDIDTHGHVIFLRNTREHFILKIYIGIKSKVCENCLLYTKPFAFDEHEHVNSECLWRCTFVEREQKLMKSFISLDNFKYIQALRIILGFMKLDRNFKALDEYDVFTVFLFVCENEIRYTGWNSKDLVTCFYTLIHGLLDSLVSSSLQHFYMRNVNLFCNLKKSDRNLIIGRLKSILNNKNEFKKFLKRRLTSKQNHLHA